MWFSPAKVFTMSAMQICGEKQLHGKGSFQHHCWMGQVRIFFNNKLFGCLLDFKFILICQGDVAHEIAWCCELWCVERSTGKRTDDGIEYPSFFSRINHLITMRWHADYVRATNIIVNLIVLLTMTSAIIVIHRWSIGKKQAWCIGRFQRISRAY